MIDDGFHCESVNNKRINNHKKKTNSIRRGPAWKKARDIFVEKNPVCAWCGKPTSTPHHDDDSQYDDDKYIACMPDCTPLCTPCHFAVHHNMEICECKGGYKVIGSRSEYCKACVPKEVLEERDRKAQAQKDKQAAYAKAQADKVREAQADIRHQQYLAAKQWKKDNEAARKANA